MGVEKVRVDEEALAEGFAPSDRLARGAFFTPGPLVQTVLDRALRWLPANAREGREPLTVVDPSAGGGAFLAGASERLPHARLFGVELEASSAEACAARVTRARVIQGDALRDGWPRLCAALPDDGVELWVGNPPYNGTSSVLRDEATYRSLRALMPEALPAGTSLRDDYAFFLLRAAARLSHRDGVLAFVTSATLLDAYLYAPLRAVLLRRLRLREVLELGDGVFRGTRVRTCVTVWTSPSLRKTPGRVRYQARAAEGSFMPEQLGAEEVFEPSLPDHLLRPAPEAARALDERWRSTGEPLTSLIPIHSPGLKTRFDELLVDAAPEVLLARVDALLRCPIDKAALHAFAQSFDIPPRAFGKLEALKESVGVVEAGADPSCVRPFWRYAGARHRGVIPEGARAWCYLDRRLIPRGDHRFRGEWDPHGGDVKLVFNTRELPLSAALLEAEGCVHDHRHARFAPLYVPRLLRDHGLGAARQGVPREALGEDVPNLSPRALTVATTMPGGPLAFFRALCRFINSREVQQIWAPSYGACRDLPVPLPLPTTS